MTTENALEAGKLLRRIARGMVRKNAFLDLRAYHGAMPTWAFGAIVSVLVALRVYSILCMVVAWHGAGLDPETWATGVPVSTELVTPFHHHVNPYGSVFQFFVTMHVLTGAALFVVCLVPLFVRKGGNTHRWFGRAFVVLWLPREPASELPR